MKKTHPKYLEHLAKKREQYHLNLVESRKKGIEYSRRSRTKHRDRILERYRLKRLTSPCPHLAPPRGTPEHARYLESKRKYYATHKTEWARYQTKWRLKNQRKINERQRMRRKLNKEYIRLKGIEHRARIKCELLAAYGSECACCGERNPAFLTLDHKTADATKRDRKSNGKRITGTALYSMLKRRGWPKDDYQILCFNCNCGRHYTGGVCPHESERQTRSA